MGGLYFAPPCRIQELQERSDAFRPCRFIVLSAFHAFVVQVPLELPALLHQHVAEPLDVLHDSGALPRSDVQPNSRARVRARCSSKTMHHVLIPPQRRRECRQLSKHERKLQPYVQRHQSSKRGAADPGVFPGRDGPVVSIHERLQLFDEESRVPVGAPAAEFGNSSRCVLANALLAGVVDSHDNQRLNRARTDDVVCGVSHMPVHPGDEGCRPIKQVLPIVQIKRRKLPSGLRVVARRQIDHQVALIPQKARTKSLMFPEVRVAHGTIFTGKSLAWMGCPGGVFFNCSSSACTRPQALTSLLVAYGASGAAKNCSSSSRNSGEIPANFWPASLSRSIA